MDTRLLEKYASDYRLKLQRDDSGTLLVPGEYGFVFQWADEWLCFEYRHQHPVVLNNVRTDAVASGLQEVKATGVSCPFLFQPTACGRWVALTIDAHRKQRDAVKRLNFSK